MKETKRILALLLAVAMMLSLFACGKGAEQTASAATNSPTAAPAVTDAPAEEKEPAVTEAPASEEPTSTEEQANEEPAEEGDGELYGKPWVMSIVQGNLPSERPELKDDFYTHYAYDFLSTHQEQSGAKISEYASDLMRANLALIEDSTQSNHDLDQLRIFFGQAMDTETLQARGLAEVQPYLDRIEAVSTIEEMNELLLADDFPFSPFVDTLITVCDTRKGTVVEVFPNFALVNAKMVGGVYYQDTDDPAVEKNMYNAVKNGSTDLIIEMMASGLTIDEVEEEFKRIFTFEKMHGKYVDYAAKSTSLPFGGAAEHTKESYLTPEDLFGACSRFPMQKLLNKLGRDHSSMYIASLDWAKAFDAIWTQENLDVIKLIARYQVLKETSKYRDRTEYNRVMTSVGLPAADAVTNAYNACDEMNTFSILLSENYRKEALGEKAMERITKLTEEILSVYKELAANTKWIGESSDRVIEKLDHLTLNVLTVKSGYYDYSGLELTPTEEGGTLMGNYLKLKQYRLDQENKLIGQPAISSGSWFYLKPTMMNAFYDSSTNSINIIPGYVTSLIYTDEMSDSELLGKIGFAIAHEISHAFDFNGAQYDAYGVPNPIFTAEDVDAFVKKCDTLAAYYDKIEVAPGTMVNGTTVVTEAAADLSGMQAILLIAQRMEDLDMEQFLKSMAEVWAMTVPPQSLPNLLADTHPLNNLRINVNLQMFDAIYETFGVQEGDGMYLAPESRIVIWGPNA